MKTFKLRINRGGMWTLEKLTNPIDDPRGYRSMYPATDDPQGQDTGQAMTVDVADSPTPSPPSQRAESFTDAADRFLARMREGTPAPVSETSETHRARSPEKRKETAKSPPAAEPKESAADRYRRELKAVEEEAKLRGKALKKIIEKEEEAAKRKKDREKDKTTTPSKEDTTQETPKKSSSKKKGKGTGKSTRRGSKGYSANIPSDEDLPGTSGTQKLPAQRAQTGKPEPPRRVKELISTEVCSTRSGQRQLRV